MENLKDYKIFSDHRTTLKQTSLDDRNGQNSEKTFMTNSTYEVVDFDAVKQEYVRHLKLSKTPKSNDALFDDKNGNLFFVEFKNGEMTSKTQFEVRKKIYDSVLMFTDITSTNISKLRECMTYILVYNEKINKNNPDPELKNKNKVQTSHSFDSIAKTIAQYANKEYICFGLTIFNNYCFKEVHTFTEIEFQKYLDNL